jgi:hypothetical protein
MARARFCGHTCRFVADPARGAEIPLQHRRPAAHWPLNTSAPPSSSQSADVLPPFFSGPLAPRLAIHLGVSAC